VSRHPLDLFSLVAGLLFAVLGALFGLDQLDALDVDLRWIPAIVLLVLGAAGIIASLTRDARLRSAAARDEPA
jgi:hypothetical protein